MARHALQHFRIKPATIIWILVAVPWVAAAILIVNTRHTTAEPLRQIRPPRITVTPTPVPRAVPAAELSAGTGHDGQDCLVAISGTVYRIPASTQWVDGNHVPANDAVYCGRDLTSQLGDSPHGASVMKSVTLVGPLVP